ncbi:MAG: GNAT family N-acetyltransferase [Anaerolineaceae bacterium]|nr:GNAT family N-acetyltransferase [Anaerolineaceae bacterium]
MTNADYAFQLVPTSQFNTQELADIYNAGRADYIVPMLTDAEHLRRYIHIYDVDLDASVVVLDSKQVPAGIGMLGVRGDRCWITRLGIAAEHREAGMGMCMMQALMATARERHARLVQLEVIEGNEPAHRLFLRCGFKETRRLMVVKRLAEARPDEPTSALKVERLNRDDIWKCLARRDPTESWVNENATLGKLESLEGLKVTLPSDDSGWIVFHRHEAEITHIIWQTGITQSAALMAALLNQLHYLYPDFTTKIENVPVTSNAWTTLQQFNYDEEFRRIEMFLHL